jgi:hypothetical protein
MYHFEEGPMERAFKKVFDKWLTARAAAPEALVA